MVGELVGEGLVHGHLLQYATPRTKTPGVHTPSCYAMYAHPRAVAETQALPVESPYHNESNKLGAWHLLPFHGKDLAHIAATMVTTGDGMKQSSRNHKFDFARAFEEDEGSPPASNGAPSHAGEDVDTELKQTYKMFKPLDDQVENDRNASDLARNASRVVVKLEPLL